MGKKLITSEQAGNKAAMPRKAVAPDRLAMHLFAPGMMAMHRAALGGLACTLKAMERQFASGRLAKSKLPAPFLDNQPPWEIDEHSVILKFGKPENAGEYLQKLFEFAFAVRKDGLIQLPGQFAEIDVSLAVLADLQAGLTLTFLQHGQVRKLAKEATLVSYDSVGEGVPGVVVEYKKCSKFKHQDGWREFVDNKGRLIDGLVNVDGPISPGTVIRHVAFTRRTAAEEPLERMMALYFALVGCLSLPVNRGVAALIVPEVENLHDFLEDRAAMTPTTARDCQIANAPDAGFRAQLRARDNLARQTAIRSKARKALRGSAIPGCYVMTFTPTPWARQQKSRVATIRVPAANDKLLDRFERALSHLPPRIVTKTVSETAARGKIKTERKESFRVDSIVRALIAENLAMGQPWYVGFVGLLTKRNPATNEPFRDQLLYERKGLYDMIDDDTMWDSESEKTVVRAVHDALRSRYGQIADENKTNLVAMKNRFRGEYNRWRLAFAGAKTADQFRNALCDLFSRGGRNSVLQKSWSEILPLLHGRSWQLARDLALLALCSYEGKGSLATDGNADSPDQT